MNALILALAATGLVLTGLGALALAGWANYRQARDQHHASQEGQDHGRPTH